MLTHHMPESEPEGKARKRKPHTTDPWYKRYPRDFYEDTRELLPDERGLYNDVLDLIYMAGGPLKDDERMLAHKMHVDVKIWRRIRKTLLAGGFLFLNRGQLHNKRAKEVLATREEERRSMGTKAGPRPEVQGNLFENPNEINGNFRPRSTELDSQKAEVERDNIIPLRASQGLAGSNGAIEPMLRDVISWMVGGDEQSAREWLSTQTKLYGERVVRDSYSKLKADIATGRLISRPISTWCAIAGRMASQAPPAQGAQHDPGNPKTSAAQRALAASRKRVAGGKP